MVQILLFDFLEKDFNNSWQKNKLNSREKALFCDVFAFSLYLHQPKL